MAGGATGGRCAGAVFERLAEHFLIDSYDPPDFALLLARKDMDLACQVGRQYDVPMKLAKLALAEMTEALNRGWADRDSRVSMTLQEERAGCKGEHDGGGDSGGAGGIGGCVADSSSSPLQPIPQQPSGSTCLY